MLLPNICLSMAALSIPALLWFFIVEDFFCENSLFPDAEDLPGLKRILLIRINGSIDRGFSVIENGKAIAEFKEFFNEIIAFDMKRSFLYRDIGLGFKLEPGFRKIEFYEGGAKIGVFRRQGFAYKRKSLQFMGLNLTLIDTEKWNPDFHIIEEGRKIATVTYDRSTHQGRDRKICFFDDASSRLESVLCMVVAFSPPKFGNIGG